MERLERKRKGIILLHDIHERTALAIPALLHELKKRGYHVVHVVPSGAEHAKMETKGNSWTPVN